MDRSLGFLMKLWYIWETGENINKNDRVNQRKPFCDSQSIDHEVQGLIKLEDFGEVMVSEENASGRGKKQCRGRRLDSRGYILNDDAEVLENTRMAQCNSCA